MLCAPRWRDSATRRADATSRRKRERARALAYVAAHMGCLSTKPPSMHWMHHGPCTSNGARPSPMCVKSGMWIRCGCAAGSAHTAALTRGLIACSHPHGHAHRERHTDTRYMYVRRRTLYMCLCNKLIVSLPACVKPYSSWEAGVRNGSMAEPAAYVFWRNHPKKRCVSPEVLFS